MQISCTSSINESNSPTRNSQMATGVTYIIENEKISSGIIAGSIAAGEKLFERMSSIDSFEKSGLSITEEKHGKELVKLLLEKKLINSIPKTIIAPFLIVGSATSLFLYQLNKLVKDVRAQ